jgi:hypothetical protein
MIQRRKDLINGIIFGAWLGAIYALGTMLLNWLLLPGIALLPLQGNTMAEYLLLYAFVGSVLGLVSSLPESPWLGVALGGASSAFVISVSGLFTTQFSAETVFRLVFGFLYTFLPMSVLLMPVAWLVRAGVNAQHPDPDHPELWARRYLIPAVLTFLVLALGTFSSFDGNQRDGIRIVRQLILDSKGIGTVEQLPKSLQTVQGYIQGRSDSYRFTISDDIENFMGPQPVGGKLSQFLVVVDFQTGLRFACIFQAGVTVAPYCTNF